jgi:uncharacterized protein (DUF427 family)
MEQETVSRSDAQAFVPPSATVEPTARWIRVKFGGEMIADSKRAQLLIQYGPGGLPTYYFPQTDVRLDLLEPVATDGQPDNAAGMAFYTVKAGDKVAERAAWIYNDPPPGLEALRGHVSFAWNEMDAWYEEGEEVFVHARDPHKRVDVLASPRHVRVVINGETVAETERARLLFETGLPTRYYIPPDDVRIELLEPTHLTTACPYKGTAGYWTAKVGDQVLRNVVWSYADPIPECPKIKGLLCFYNERVDLYVDGELQERPVTPWSR